MRRFAAVFLIFAALAAADGFLLERYWVKFPEVEFRSERIPPAFDGYRIAIISDLHLGSLDPPAWVRWVLRRTNEQKADIIVGLGDYVKKSGATEELKQVWPLLKELNARDGVFLVNGNHDHWADDALALQLLEESGHSLRHRHVILRRGGAGLVLAGAGDLWEDEPGVDKSLSSADPELFTLLLAHNPDTADLPHQRRVDLFLTGHTHGGQVRIPLIGTSPILPVKNKSYDLGLRTSVRGEKVFISAGIGWSILPLRFFCRAEVPILVLRHQPR